MKKALIIVAAVAAYALIEVGLLLSSIATEHWLSPWTYPAAVMWSQFLLIPTMAALLSRIIYGRQDWIRRTVTILLAGSLGLPIAVLLFFIPMVLLVALLVWASGVHWILFWLLLPVVVGLMVTGFLFLVRKSGKRTVQAEAERWLAERQSEVSESDRAWRNRGIRIAVCVPLLIVLPIFLFLPETWGILSHLGQPQSGNLSGYRVRTPASWIVFNYIDPQTDGRSWVTGLAGRGIGFGANPLRFDSLSSWSVGTDPFNSSEESSYYPIPRTRKSSAGKLSQSETRMSLVLIIGPHLIGARPVLRPSSQHT